MSSTLFLVDPHRVLCEALRTFIEKRGDLVVVGEASDGVQAFEAVRRLGPDVVVTELLLPKLHGVDLIARLRSASSRSRAVVLSSEVSDSVVERALEAGAASFVCKTDSAKELLDAIDATLDGRSYLSPTIAQSVVNAISGRRQGRGEGLGTLTSREREILQLLAEGLSSKEIAARLGVSTRTVESHRAHVMHKLDVHKVAGLVRYAIREGLVAA